jgi:hypothetical protein
MADDLIARLRAGGEANGTGAFTLDPARARAKLREFQLADPFRYVLLLVQALAVRNATHVDVDIDADDVRVTSDAQPLSATQLEDLYLLLFADGPPTPGLRELALGLNAAMATDPQYVRVECGGAPGEPGAVLEQRNDAPDRVTITADVSPGVRVVVHQRFSLGLIKRFFVASRGNTREQQLLREHCSWAGIPIRLGGKALLRPHAAAGIESLHPIVVDGVRLGDVGLSPAGERGRLELIRHHVWLRSHVFDDPSLRGLEGVVDVSHLRTDASMADVVRDADYDALIAAVHAARDVALAAVCRQHRDGRGHFAGPLREVLCSRIAALLAVPTADPRAEPLCDYLAVPLWFDLAGLARRSDELVARPMILYADVETKEVPEGFEDVLFARGHAEALLRATFGARVTSCAAPLRRALLARRNRAALEARLHAVALPAHTTYDVVRRFEGQDIAGVIGWAPNLGPSWIRIILVGRLLVELPLVAELSTIHVVVAAPFRPDELFADVLHDATFTAAMHATMTAFAALVADVCVRLRGPTAPPAQVGEDLLRYMLAVLGGTHAQGWLVRLGVAPSSIAELCAARGEPWALKAGSFSGPDAHPFAHLSMFTDAAGAAVDLARIDAAVDQEGFVRVITLGRPVLREPPALVVRVGELRLTLLEAIYGKANVRKVGREYEQWLARQELAAREPTPRRIAAPCTVGPIEFTEDGRPCVVGVHARIDPKNAGPGLRVFVEGRAVTTMPFPAALRGIEAIVDLDDRWLSSDVDELRKGAEVVVERLCAAAVDRVLGTLVAHADVADPRRIEIVLDALALALPGPGFVAAWIGLGDVAPELRTPAYIDLLELGDRRSPTHLGTLLERATSQLQTLDFEAIRTAVLAGPKRTSTWSRMPVTAVGHLGALLAYPVLPTAGGSLRPFGSLLDELARTGRIGYLGDATDVPAAFTDVAVLSGTRLATVSALVGARVMRDRSAEVEAARTRRAFEAREPLAELALPPGEALASIVVEIDGIRGVLGVPRRAPNSGPGVVTITRARRPIARIDATPGTAWIGILDGDGFGEELDFESLTERELDRIAEIIHMHRPMIVAALCAVGLDDADGHARQWVQHLLRGVLPFAGPEQFSLDRAGVAQVALLPLFAASDGTPRTLLDLRTMHDEHRSLMVVRRRGLQLDRPLVWIRDEIEYALLRHLFGELEDGEPAAERRAAFGARLAACAPLPTAPADAFVVETIRGRGLDGALWLSSAVDATSTIALGIDGRAVSTWPGSTMFPCAGAVTGDGVTIAADFSGCELSRSREDHLKSAAAKLYTTLVASMRPAFAPVDDPRSTLLRALLLRLHEIRRADRKWPSHEMRRLYRDLEDAPLLPLASGRGISLRMAVATRPQEWATLLPGGAVEAEVDDGPTVADPVQGTAPVAAPAVPGAGESHGAAPTPAPQAPVEAPDPEPPPPPPPPPPTPEAVLRARVLAELRLLRHRDAGSITGVRTEVRLEAIGVDALDGRHVAARRGTEVFLDTRHPIVRRALAPNVDPLLVSVLASSALTALNALVEELTDADEARLLRLHAEHLQTMRGAPRA